MISIEPTLSQIKEYVWEKGINVFENLKSEHNIENNKSLLFGDGNNEVYFQFYLEHSVEIAEWLSENAMHNNCRIEGR